MSGKIKKGKGKGKFNFFFSLMKRSKNHTRSVVYEKTVHAHSAIYEKTAKNLILRLKSFNSAPALKDFHALIIYFLYANSVMSGEEKDENAAVVPPIEKQNRSC